jgi:hypothetical protein
MSVYFPDPRIKRTVEIYRSKEKEGICTHRLQVNL